jgi:hypothetical protein
MKLEFESHSAVAYGKKNPARLAPRSGHRDNRTGVVITPAREPKPAKGLWREKSERKPAEPARLSGRRITALHYPSVWLVHEGRCGSLLGIRLRC